MLSLQSFLREGRVVGPCWEKLKPKGPKWFGLVVRVGGRNTAFPLQLLVATNTTVSADQGA